MDQSHLSQYLSILAVVKYDVVKYDVSVHELPRTDPTCWKNRLSVKLCLSVNVLVFLN